MPNGEDGVPAADPATVAGLRMPFELGADGHSDRAIGQALNQAGHRAQGRHGSNPFTKDTVCVMLLTRFLTVGAIVTCRR